MQWGLDPVTLIWVRQWLHEWLAVNGVWRMASVAATRVRCGAMPREASNITLRSR